MQNSLAQAATVADEAVILRKKPIDVEQTHDLSVLVWSRNPYAAKVHFSFSFLVVVGIVYIVARLS